MRRHGLLGAALVLASVAAPGADAAPPPSTLYLPWTGAVPIERPTSFTHPLPGGGTHTYWSWGVQAMGAPALWDQGWTGKGVTVAIIDTGIELSHPYLASSVVWGISHCGYTSSPNDDNGHGTHVAGIVKQMAPDVKFYVVKALDSLGSGAGCGANINNAMLAGLRGPDGALGTADDADIVQVSIGQIVPIGTSLALTGADPFAVAHAQGAVFVAAAGNSYVTPGVDSPAAYASVVAVGAMGSDTGSTRLVAEYSSNGITDRDDAVVSTGEIELAAAGTNVVSSYRGGGTASSSGTSMASPHVSGLAALLEQAQPDLPSASVRARLRCAARDVALGGKLTAPGYDLSTGYGIPDAGRVVSGPCHPALTAADMPEEARALADESVDLESDYDGDGRPDVADHANLRAESLVAPASANDYVEVGALGFGDFAAVTAPDGRTMVVEAPLAQLTPFRVYLDGRVVGASGIVVSGTLVGAPADGTWWLRPGALFVLVGQPTTLTVGGKRLSVDGWCCAGPIVWSSVPWNWHRAGPATTQAGSLALPGATQEQSPLYGRYYG